MVDKRVGKISSVMTSSAIQDGRDVRWIGNVNLADCIGAIMTGLAGYPRTQNLWTRVVRVGARKVYSRRGRKC